MDEPILVSERHEQVVVLRLNRPDRSNALSPELIAALGEALIEAERDDDVRCVVLTGTGERAFCGGMDLRSFSEGKGPTDGSRAGVEGFTRFTRGEIDVPVVAAVNATAVAGGFELVLACDLAVASTQARFGVPEVKRGLFAAGGGVFLGNRLPLAVALELTLTGDLIDAARALELGLVNRVVDPPDVMEAAMALARILVANGPLAVKATRQIVRASSTDMARARDLCAEWQPVVFGSEDAQEGARAFVEKRLPVWKGR